mmetsp:Transcript_26365/g.83786  ORF Transcript_26365/g.83786 Transcript_26365/m.83786 type:complete len:414 (-) Transcript_26365:244-1485(-)
MKKIGRQSCTTGSGANNHANRGSTDLPQTLENKCSAHPSPKSRRARRANSRAGTARKLGEHLARLVGEAAVRVKAPWLPHRPHHFRESIDRARAPRQVAIRRGGSRRGHDKARGGASTAGGVVHAQHVAGLVRNSLCGAHHLPGPGLHHRRGANNAALDDVVAAHEAVALLELRVVTPCEVVAERAGARKPDDIAVQVFAGEQMHEVVVELDVDLVEILGPPRPHRVHDRERVHLDRGWVVVRPKVDVRSKRHPHLRAVVGDESVHQRGHVVQDVEGLARHRVDVVPVLGDPHGVADQEVLEVEHLGQACFGEGARLHLHRAGVGCARPDGARGGDRLLHGVLRQCSQRPVLIDESGDVRREGLINARGRGHPVGQVAPARARHARLVGAQHVRYFIARVVHGEGGAQLALAG